jgi:hypothetical protein
MRWQDFLLAQSCRDENSVRQLTTNEICRLFDRGHYYKLNIPALEVQAVDKILAWN